MHSGYARLRATPHEASAGPRTGQSTTDAEPLEVTTLTKVRTGSARLAGFAGCEDRQGHGAFTMSYRTLLAVASIACAASAPLAPELLAAPQGEQVIHG